MRGVIVTTHNRLGFVKGAPKGLLDGCEHFEEGEMALDACQVHLRSFYPEKE